MASSDRNLEVVRVVVLSPGDVAEERNTVALVVGELNRRVARSHGCATPLSWHDSIWSALRRRWTGRSWRSRGSRSNLRRLDGCGQLREGRDAAEERYAALEAAYAQSDFAATMGPWESLSLQEQRDLVRALIKQVLITPGRGRQRVDVQEMPDIADQIEIR